MLNILNKILTQNKTSNTKKNQGIEETVLFKNPSNLDEYKDKKLIDTIISTEKKENSNLNDLDDVIYKAKISKYQLDKDVILSKITRNELEESLAKIQFHKIIYEDWGFGEVDKLGRSSILNFYGHPGTGKTLTAEAFAGQLDLPIIQLGIAEIESKLMGETSKNIQQAFTDAQKQGAILFFDEADTLLGKRLSSVTQGVDNEVNAMRSTMLIELEKFDGIVIFATNFAKNYDEAFRSRITYHVEFTLPDYDTRIKLWSRMLVEKIPLFQNRDELLELCASESDGFSGREIRTCMRLALPKVLKEAHENQIEAQLNFNHILSAIAQVKKSQKEVANNSDQNSMKRQRAVQEANLARKILGTNKETQVESEEANSVSSVETNLT